MPHIVRRFTFNIAMSADYSLRQKSNSQKLFFIATITAVGKLKPSALTSDYSLFRRLIVPCYFTFVKYVVETHLVVK